MKIIVLGDGLLGTEIIKQTKWDYISRKKDKFDFNIIESYIPLIKEYDTILNCIANTNTYLSDRNSFRDTNYKSVIDLSNYLNKNNKKLIHISTDYVYANSSSDAKETDLPLISDNWYTYYKLMADEYIQAKNNNYLICRCSFKPNPFPFDKAWLSPIGNFDYVDKIASIIIKLINKDCTGVINVGTNRKNIHELAVQSNKNITPINAPNHVPSDVTMCLDKLNKLV